MRKTLAVQEIALDTFAVRLDRARDGGIVLPRPEPSPGPARPEPAHKGTPAWKVLVERLRLQDGQIGFRDFAVAEKPQEFETKLEFLDAKDLALVIDASGAKPGKINLDALIGGGRFALEATYEMKPMGPALDSHVTLADFPIGETRVYLPDLGWSDLHGLFSANLHHHLELGGAHHTSGTAVLTDVAVTVPGITEPPLGWKNLSVEIGSVDIVRRTAAVSKVLLEGAHVLLDPQGKSFVPALRPKKAEVSATPAAAPAPSPAPAAAAAAPAWTWKVSEVEVKGARVDVLGGSQPLVLAIDAKVSGLSHEFGNRVPLSLTLAEAQGSLAVEGGFTLAPPGFDGSIRIADLALGPLVEPFAPAIGRLLRSGAARAELQLAAGRPASPKDPSAGGVRASGKLGITSLEVVDADPKDFRLAWKELALEIHELFVPGILAQAGSGKPGAVTISLDRFQLTEPAIRLTKTQTGLLLPQTGAPPAAPTPQGTPPSSPAPAPPAKGDAGAPVVAEVKRMEVARARIEVMDRTTKPVYRAEIFPLDFAATGVRWPGPVAKQVKLSARTIEGGSFLVTGSLDPRGSDLTAKLEGLPLGPFNPYASGTGYSVGGGAATFDSKIKFAGPNYDVNTHVVIRKLDVAGEQGDTLFLQRFGVPLEFALALLTDVEGDIVLDVPLTHNASGTSVGLGTIIGEALAHALLNAIASPLKLITSVAEIGGKVENLTPKALGFLPGRAEFALGEADRVDQIAALMARSPGLHLHLQGDTGPEDDRWLREQALRARLEGGDSLGGRLRALTTERAPSKAALAYLTGRAAGKDTPLPDEYKAWFEEKVAQEVVPPADLQKLAEERAARVHSLLVEGSAISQDRVIVDASAGDVGKGQPAVALGLGAAPRRAKAEALAP